MTDYTFSHILQLDGTISAGTLTWTAKTTGPNSSNHAVTDVASDGDIDANDYYFVPGTTFSGYYYTALNGNTFAVFGNPATGPLLIPFDAASYNLEAEFAATGGTPVTASPGDFVPTGNPVCFAADSLIATPTGERAVQDLKIGDPVLTLDGRAVPVKWLGYQTLYRFRHGPHMQPVRIRAGALGNGLPHSDLTVTADHGMVFTPASHQAVGGLKQVGYVINASALVNGTTIDFVPMAELEDSFVVYHIELEDHDVVLANGAPSETFIDAAGRKAFDNHQDYIDLYETERIIPEMRLSRITARRLLPEEVKTRLSADHIDVIKRLLSTI